MTIFDPNFAISTKTIVFLINLSVPLTTTEGNQTCTAFLTFGSLLVSGSYHNNFSIFDRQSKNEVTIEATKVVSKIKKPMKMKPPKKKSKDEVNPDHLDYGKKILHVAWHPSENLIAVGASNNLFLFNAP